MDRKNQIVNLARELIETHGYHGFSYANLEDSLGIRKASIHHHFPKKEDLALAVLDEVEQCLKSKASEVSQLSTSGWPKIEAFLAQTCSLAVNEKRVCATVALQYNHECLPKVVKNRVEELCGLQKKIVVDILSEGRSEGTLHFKGSVEAKALSILAITQGATHYTRVFGSSVIDAMMNELKSGLIG